VADGPARPASSTSSTSATVAFARENAWLDLAGLRRQLAATE
jgi:hypothetical protein